ncbi:hypothetical protein RJ639_004358 [Escallonia herrerae]|uniref:Uncharacterized protein n=1 Tax=Escallonia herrerae TaxID=1293975 RepID=A0AA88W0U1_9ASTE|nr:hypothetical protein RJ639_004358 [Escallonia herrerae]
MRDGGCTKSRWKQGGGGDNRLPVIHGARPRTEACGGDSGQGQEQRPVEVIHEPHSATPDVAGTGGGVLASAAASVSATLHSAKEAISKK